MKPAVVDPPCYEFYFAQLDTLVTVENLPHGPIVRASRNTFSAERKACFVRELAAEGFIADQYRWDPAGVSEDIRWVVDQSAFLPGAACVVQTRRFVHLLFGSAVLLWLLLMTGVILHAAR